MTLIEAVKSGRKFKRPRDGDWLTVYGHNESQRVSVYLEDVLAEDWEVEPEEKRLFSISQLNDLAICVSGINYGGPSAIEVEVLSVWKHGETIKGGTNDEN